MDDDSITCKYCGVSYLVYNTIQALEQEILQLINLLESNSIEHNTQQIKQEIIDKTNHRHSHLVGLHTKLKLFKLDYSAFQEQQGEFIVKIQDECLGVKNIVHNAISSQIFPLLERMNILQRETSNHLDTIERLKKQNLEQLPFSDGTIEGEKDEGRENRMSSNSTQDHSKNIITQLKETMKAQQSHLVKERTLNNKLREENFAFEKSERNSHYLIADHETTIKNLESMLLEKENSIELLELNIRQEREKAKLLEQHTKMQEQEIHENLDLLEKNQKEKAPVQSTPEQDDDNKIRKAIESEMNEKMEQMEQKFLKKMNNLKVNYCQQFEKIETQYDSEVQQEKNRNTKLQEENDKLQKSMKTQQDLIAFLRLEIRQQKIKFEKEMAKNEEHPMYENNLTTDNKRIDILEKQVLRLSNILKSKEQENENLQIIIQNGVTERKEKIEPIEENVDNHNHKFNHNSDHSRVVKPQHLPISKSVSSANSSAKKKPTTTSSLPTEPQKQPSPTPHPHSSKEQDPPDNVEYLYSHLGTYTRDIIRQNVCESIETNMKNGGLKFPEPKPLIRRPVRTRKVTSKPKNPTAKKPTVARKKAALPLVKKKVSKTRQKLNK